MVSLPSREPILFDRPAIYQIIVQGKVSPTLSDRLEGMMICRDKEEAKPPTTILQGELIDQAALAGVLNTLYEWHLTVILVKRLEG